VLGLVLVVSGAKRLAIQPSSISIASIFNDKQIILSNISIIGDAA
jgi:hypothetical protein